MARKKERKEEMNKIIIFTFGFLNFEKSWLTYRVDLAIVFHGVALIPYVQVAILNLPHP